MDLEYFNIPLYNEMLYSRSILEQEEFESREELEQPSIHAMLSQVIYQSKLKEQEIYFITLNPRPRTDSLAFIEKVHTLKGRSYLPNLRYCFEQRGESLEKLGEGIHVHMVCIKKKGISPKQMLNNLESLFKKFMPRNGIDIKKYPHAFLKEKLLYMQGVKWAEEKTAKVKMDKLFREKFDLKNIYE